MTAVPPGAARAPLRLAVVMSRFPKLTETFILGEVLALRDLGADVRLYPLLRQRDALVHRDAAALVAEARYLPFLSPAIVASNLRLAFTRPRRYFGALARVMRETWGSLNFLAGGLAIFPKVAHAALEMEAQGVDHVHAHFASHPALAAFVIRRLTGIPYSFTAHGSDLHVDRHMLCTKVEAAAFVATVSDYNRRLIERECPAAAGRVEVIRTGVDLSVFRRADRPRRAGLNAICVGTLHEVKGQVHLVAACAALRRRGIDVRCTLVGDGPDRRTLTRLVAERGLTDVVELAGPRTREEVARLVAEADVLVAPSVPTRAGKREGIPVVLVEAMASGTPVVASSLSGVPELVEDGVTGLLAPPGDPAAIADALERLHRDPTLARRLADAAAARVAEEYEVVNNARRVLERIAKVRS